MYKNDDSVGGYKEVKSSAGQSAITVEWEEDGNKVESPPAPNTSTKDQDKKAEPEKTAPEKKKKTPKWLEEKE